MSGATDASRTVGRAGQLIVAWLLAAFVLAGVLRGAMVGGITWAVAGVFTGFELLPVQYQKGYFMSDAQLEYTTSDDRFSIAGYVTNIENNNVVGYSQPQPQGPSLNVLSLRAPRMYGVRIGAKF